MKRHGSLALVVAGLLAGLVQSSAVDLGGPLRGLVTAAAMVGTGVLGWRSAPAKSEEMRPEA